MTLQWLAADLATGRVLADMPSFEPDWPVKRSISGIEEGQGSLHLDGAPENWERALQEANAVLACYDDALAADGSQPNPIVWAGIVWATLRDAGTDAVRVTLMSTF